MVGVPFKTIGNWDEAEGKPPQKCGWTVTVSKVRLVVESARLRRDYTHTTADLRERQGDQRCPSRRHHGRRSHGPEGQQ